MTAKVDYSPSTSLFQTLPLLIDAKATFDRAEGDKFVKEAQNLFERHKMTRRFGLAMLHRHSELGPREIMVEYHGTSTPWSVVQEEGMVDPHPCTWGFSDGKLIPLEFSYSNEGQHNIGDEELATFAASLSQLLQTWRVEKLFGLCKYPGDDFEGSCEITMGRTNINLLPKDVSQYSRPAAIFRRRVSLPVPCDSDRLGSPGSKLNPPPWFRAQS